MWLPPSKQQQDGFKKTWLQQKTETMCHREVVMVVRGRGAEVIPQTFQSCSISMLCSGEAPGELLSNHSTIQRLKVCVCLCEIRKSFQGWREVGAVHTNVVAGFYSTEEFSLRPQLDQFKPAAAETLNWTSLCQICSWGSLWHFIPHSSSTQQCQK